MVLYISKLQMYVNTGNIVFRGIIPPRMCRKRLKIASFWKYATPKTQNKQSKSMPN